MPKPPVIGLDEWKAKAKKGEAPTECLLRKGLPFADVTKLDDNADGLLRARFVISASTPDRDEDTIAMGGFELADYQKNPQVLWSHDYYGTPVTGPTGIGLTTLGLSQEITLIGETMESVVVFQPKDVNPFANTIAQLVLHPLRFIRAASVGFKPKKYAFNEQGGVDWLIQLLLEWSICVIGMHADALSEAKAAGIELAGVKEWAETVLAGCEGAGLWVPKAQAEAVYKLFAAGKTISIPALALKGIDAEDIRTVLTGDVQLLAADGTVLRSLVTRDADGAAAGDAGAAAGGEGSSTEGATPQTDAAGATEGASGGAEGAAAGDSAAQAGAEPAAATETPAAEVTASANLDQAVARFFSSEQGVDTLATAFKRAGATPPAAAEESGFSVDPAILRQAASELSDETFGPLQAALTSATGHLG